jgi:hypothetical protein
VSGLMGLKSSVQRGGGLVVLQAVSRANVRVRITNLFSLFMVFDD